MSDAALDAPVGPVGHYPRPAILKGTEAKYIVVEAAAGTGKTFFLEHRVADLILSSNAKLDEILLVTFTEKAAGELRVRIRALIDKLIDAQPQPMSAVESSTDAVWHIDEATRARLRMARWAFDRAAIHTIHAFCHRILTEDVFDGRRRFDETQVSDGTAFAEAFRAVIRERFARNHDERALLNAYLRNGHSIDDLAKTMLSAVRSGAPLDTPEAGATASHAAALRVALPALADIEGVIVAANVNKVSLGRCSRELRALIVALTNIAPDDNLLAAATIDANRVAVEYLSRTLAAKSEPTALTDALGRAATFARPLLPQLVAQLLPAITERIETDKRARGQFDYQDMIRQVAELLDGPRGEALAARLRERHPWAMIDEFQDTDDLQWKIFRRVWMHDDARGLTIVGDPKQAIYAFRGADVVTYYDARDELMRLNETRIPLVTNRRSSASLVQAINQLITTNGFFTGKNCYDDIVDSDGRVIAEGGGAPLRIWRLRGEGRISAELNRDVLLHRIADEIELLLGDQPMQYSVGGAQRTVLARDIFVLVRSNREVNDVVAALSARGIPCTQSSNADIMMSREADEILDVLRAIAAPGDRRARMRAWMTRFFAIPLDQLTALSEASDHHPLVAVFYDWAATVAKRRSHRLGANIMADSQIETRALAFADGERLLTNMRQLFELITADLAHHGGDLAHAISAFEQRVALAELKGADDEQPQRLATEADAVQVMTMHKAKGLEAAIVFLYGANGKSGHGQVVHTYHDLDDQRRLWIKPSKDDATETSDGIGDRVNKERRQEYERLDYVALTRAKVRMYLPLYTSLDATASYEPIQAALGAMLPDVSAQHRVIEDVVAELPTVVSAPLDALADFSLDDNVLHTLETVVEPSRITTSQRGDVLVSYSLLTQRGITATLSDDTRELGEVVVENDDDIDDDITEPIDSRLVLPPGADTGLLLHELLERAKLDDVASCDTATWIERPDVIAMATSVMAHHRAPLSARATALTLVHRALTTPPSWPGGKLPAVVDASAVAREVPFLFPLNRSGIDATDGFAQGVLDALVVWNDQLWVIDWKSDQLAQPTQKAARRIVDERYAVQAQLYALAAQRIATPERPLAGVLYWFLRDHIIVAIPATPAALVDWATWLATVDVTPPEMQR